MKQMGQRLSIPNACNWVVFENLHVVHVAYQVVGKFDAYLFQIECGFCDLMLTLVRAALDVSG